MGEENGWSYNRRVMLALVPASLRVFGTELLLFKFSYSCSGWERDGSMGISTFLWSFGVVADD